MMQIINCECGESTISDGRCIKCRKVRPSSSEIIEMLLNNVKENEKNLKLLEEAIKLEKKDVDNENTM